MENLQGNSFSHSYRSTQSFPCVRSRQIAMAGWWQKYFTKAVTSILRWWPVAMPSSTGSIWATVMLKRIWRLRRSRSRMAWSFGHRLIRLCLGISGGGEQRRLVCSGAIRGWGVSSCLPAWVGAEHAIAVLFALLIDEPLGYLMRCGCGADGAA